MTLTASNLLWAMAAAISLALHTALGIVLYAMPVPEAGLAPPTEITVETLESGIATQTAPPAVLAATSTDAVSLAPDLPENVAASAAEANTTLQPVTPEPEPEAARPTASDNLSPVREDDVAVAALESTEVGALQPAPPVAAAQDEIIAPAPSENLTVAPASDENFASAAEPVETLVPSASPELLPPASQGPVLGPALPDELQIAPAEPVSEVAVSAIAPDTAAIAPDAAVVDRAPVETNAVPVTQGAAAIAPTLPSTASNVTEMTPQVPITIGKSDLAPASSTSAEVAPSPPTAAAALPSTDAAPLTIAPSSALPASEAAPGVVIVAPTASQAATILAPSENFTPPTAGTEVAMLPRPNVPSGSGQRPARLRIADFLTEQKDATECLLAVPAGVGLQEASIAAFSDAPDKVVRLGDEYERRSGLELQTETYPVSKLQCGALAFARDLAHYPNFPIRMTLSSPTIGSGDELAGVISGLRKDTLYLMVVDDEGKAELVQSYDGLRANTMPFHAPMTLTSGPVASVQLLVAIAADGPLKTVAERPGMPADDYFSQLRDEIIEGNRSIAYGIVAFAVQ